MGESTGADRLRSRRRRRPKEIAKAFEVKETEMSKRGVGYVVADGSSDKNYGEKNIVGYTDSGESVDLRIQCTDAKNALCSVHKMNSRGNVVVLDGGRSYVQNKETGQMTDQLRRGAVRYAHVVAVEGRGDAGGDRASFEGESARDLGHGE